MAYSIRYIPITKYEKRQYEYQPIDYQQLIERIINGKEEKTELDSKPQTQKTNGSSILKLAKKENTDRLNTERNNTDTI
jgi:anaerobic selenocysteine-containing dehydrogenase